MSAFVPRSDESTAFANVFAGHWTDELAKTGCTVVLFDRQVSCAVDIRGGAPGTRETDLLGSGMLVRSVDAIVFTGGSALGLAAADGVVQALRERGRGVMTPAGPIPIVPAAVIFDLAVGQPIAPDAASGRTALLSAVPLPDVRRGRVGAGTGATSNKLLRTDALGPGGIGLGSCSLADGSAVMALAVVNAAGAVVDPFSSRHDSRERIIAELHAPAPATATTLVVVVLPGPADHRALERAAIAAHDGMARAIVPCHTLFDGDVVFATSRADNPCDATRTTQCAIATEIAVERAIRDAIAAEHPALSTTFESSPDVEPVS